MYKKFSQIIMLKRFISFLYYYRGYLTSRSPPTQIRSTFTPERNCRVLLHLMIRSALLPLNTFITLDRRDFNSQQPAFWLWTPPTTFPPFSDHLQTEFPCNIDFCCANFTTAQLLLCHTPKVGANVHNCTTAVTPLSQNCFRPHC